jgi:3-hydroxyisobutyrate dehydrogenase-like beta-hydroxyacid dehydrogenase
MSAPGHDEASGRVGLIGVGSAGRALLEALSVHRTVRVYDRDPGRLADLAATCRRAPAPAASAVELAREADLVIFSLPTPAASHAVAEEIRDAVGPHTTLVETSTVGPEDVEAVHAILAPAGCRVVDAAVVGGVRKLANGQGVFLLGAAEGDAGLAGEVLGAVAEELFFLGARGGGMRAKLIVNAVAHAVYVVLAEAGALAAAQEIPLPVLQRLLARESGLMRPLTHRFGERLRAHDFAGGMSTVNARKDSGLMLEAARALGVPLFAMPAAHAVYELAVREGLGSLDYASIGQLWERWLGLSFADQADA